MQNDLDNISQRGQFLIFNSGKPNLSAHARIVPNGFLWKTRIAIYIMLVECLLQRFDF